MLASPLRPIRHRIPAEHQSPAPALSRSAATGKAAIFCHPFVSARGSRLRYRSPFIPNVSISNRTPTCSLWSNATSVMSRKRSCEYFTIWDNRQACLNKLGSLTPHGSNITDRATRFVVLGKEQNASRHTIEEEDISSITLFCELMRH